LTMRCLARRMCPPVPLASIGAMVDRARKQHKSNTSHPIRGDGRGGVKMATVRVAAGRGRCRCVGWRSCCRAGARVGE
jgi:hypothetical protein